MPDRELRHMRRTELVEIILALKQSEDQLRAENAALSAQLQERQIHIENAGSIAQAALELNKVFEAAQAAADEYVASVRAANKNTNAAASALRAQAEAEAQQILAQAQTEAANLKARTRKECDEQAEAAAVAAAPAGGGEVSTAAVRRGNGSRRTQARPDRSGLQGNACPDAAGDPAAPGRF